MRKLRVSRPLSCLLLFFSFVIFCTVGVYVFVSIAPRMLYDYLDGGELVQSARGSNWEKVKSLLKDGADPNSQDDRGRTALMWAAGHGSPDVVELLLKKGADPNHKSLNYGQTALDYANFSPDSPEKKRIVLLLNSLFA